MMEIRLHMVSVVERMLGSVSAWDFGTAVLSSWQWSSNGDPVRLQRLGSYVLWRFGGWCRI